MGVPELLAPPAGWGPGMPLAEVASALDGCDPETALSLIETMEQIKRWADGITVAATRVMALGVTAEHIDSYAHDNEGELTERAEKDAAHEAQLAVADEISIAVGLGAARSRDLVGLACAAPERTAVGMAGLLDGTTSLYRVVTLWLECRDLPPAIANAIAGRVLAPTRDGVPLSQRLFRQRLNRQLAKHNTPKTLRSKALAGRDATGWQRGDGTGELNITGASERIIAAHNRIAEIAEFVRAQGDSRTLAQLRSDIALDLLLYGAPAGAETCAHTGACPGSAGSGELPGGGLAERLAQALIDFLDPPTPWWEAFTGALPPARVTVTVPLNSLLGFGDEPAEITTTGGAEYLPAWLARDIAFAAGSTWRRLVTDPHTGHAIGAPSGSYTPPPRMRARIQARDHTCRAPGCTHPAERCDLPLRALAPWSDQRRQPLRQTPPAPQPQDPRPLELRTAPRRLHRVDPRLRAQLHHAAPRVRGDRR